MLHGVVDVAYKRRSVGLLEREKKKKKKKKKKKRRTTARTIERKRERGEGLFPGGSNLSFVSSSLSLPRRFVFTTGQSRFAYEASERERQRERERGEDRS